MSSQLRLLGRQLGEVKQYARAQYLLDTGVAILVFRKQNGELRTMLCTRNYQIAQLYTIDTHISVKDVQKAIDKGNITVTDLIVGETRVVNISRIAYSAWFTGVTTKDDLDVLTNTFSVIKERWSTFDELDDIRKSVFLRAEQQKIDQG